MSRSTTWAVALLVVTFAAGVAVGVGSRAIWTRHAQAAAPERRRGPDHLVRELNEALRLTPAQRDTVHAILQRHWARMTEVWETVRPGSTRCGHRWIRRSCANWPWTSR